MARHTGATEQYKRDLEWFKANERPEVVLFFENNHRLIRVLVAWKSMGVGRRRRILAPAHTKSWQAWDWLWAHSVYSEEQLARACGLTGAEVKSYLQILIVNRIIYPDGTISRYVEQYLKTRVLKLFGRPRGNGRAGPRGTEDNGHGGTKAL